MSCWRFNAGFSSTSAEYGSGLSNCVTRCSPSRQFRFRIRSIDSESIISKKRATAVLENALEKEGCGRFWNIDSPFEGVASTAILPNEVQAGTLCIVSAWRVYQVVGKEKAKRGRENSDWTCSTGKELRVRKKISRFGNEGAAIPCILEALELGRCLVAERRGTR